jgi:hypothetical protein
MTTELQAEANRRNALSSTGPRTPNGKVIVARNAVRHGAFSALPVIPGVERPEDWEAHHTGIVQHLAPVGLLETRLAERVAQLLWRLDRVIRYETAVIAVGREEATDELAPNALTQEPGQENETSKLPELKADLERERWFLARAETVVALAGRLPGLADAEPVAWAETYPLLEAAYCEVFNGVRVPWPGDDEFLEGIGLSGDQSAEEVNWTAELVRRGLALFAKIGRTSVEQLTQRAVRSSKASCAEYTVKVEELAGEVKALQRRRRTLTERALARRTLPDDSAEAKVLRYEAHLNRHLFQTLHELERIQASRTGHPVPVPIAVEVGVDVSRADQQ